MISKHAALATLAVLAASVPAQAAITISSGATANMTCSAGICTPTATQAVLNAGDLQNMLQAHNVRVTTTGAGVQAGSIRVAAPFGWSGTSTLLLVVHRAVEIDQAVSVTGSGGLSIAYKSGGHLIFGPKGGIGFSSLSSLLKINGAKFRLVSDIATLASAISAKPDGNYALANDYDASQDGTYGSSPVPTPLKGAFNGLGHTISNLFVDDKGGRTAVGLFELVLETGSIANVRLKDEKLNVEQDSQVTAGGLVDQNWGVLFDDQAQGSITESHCCRQGGESAGGLVGVNNGSISYGSAKVHIRTHGLAGGLLAANAGSVSLSHASGDVHARSEAGGLIGENLGTISQSYATGSVTGGDNNPVGGLVGISQDSSADISDSYSTGAVIGGANSRVGGFAGENDSTIENSYSTGAVSAGKGSFLGGFSGFWAGANPFQNCYWDTDTSGTDEGTGGGNVDDITGLTTQQLQSGLPSGFDPAIWTEQSGVNTGIPFLIANRPKK